ncbi:MAG TPA: pyrroline-5-carboxylate reductase dimerization domain-containing protein [Solirubrobacterales bacterium]|nr:pyrroline-5-carboxylate reductase dimerization domain-containing protein [Solirubrobacterales bacterium]
MIVGFCGSGSMAAAMARGMRDDVDGMLFTDSGSGRAEALAEEFGGEAVDTNRELAERADVVVLAVKPAKLEEAAAEMQDARAIVSLLGATSLERVRAAFPSSEVVRVMPNVGVEVRRGVLCMAGVADAELRSLLGGLGHLVELPDGEFDAATAVMGCAPAYLALALEAIAAAGIADGLAPDLAQELVVEMAAGTAELLRGRDPTEVRRAVASPGGSTEAGLEALDREGAARAFEAAVRASLERMRG